jgi:hypothetical protein
MVMVDRVDWLMSGCKITRQERIDTVPNLLKRVKEIEVQLSAWRSQWQQQNPLTATAIFNWAFYRAQSDAYRPGISGVFGPDVFNSNIYEASSPPELFPGHELDADPETFTAMQDVALYTTILVWTTRLARYLGGAAKSPLATDFFTAPFHTSCTCCSTMPLSECETEPPDEIAAAMDPAMKWNASACHVAVAPMRLVPPARTVAAPPPITNSSFRTASDVRRTPSVFPLPLVPNAQQFIEEPTTLLPGDVRFSSQLRILAWLCERLPASRPHVLATLAAIGLGHCGHDVRPAEGIREVSQTVEGVLARTGVEGASNVLLKSYKGVGVAQAATSVVVGG